MSKWESRKIGKVICFNPVERIKKGKLAKKIAMEKLVPFQKKILGFEISSYSAGPKFRNGDTLLAKITPCLENGKTAQVDILEDKEIAFGSSEFIVLRENEYSINDFIYYLAKSPAFRKRAISCMEGTSGRKRVNEGALKLQELPFPSISIQEKIAAVLSAFDNKIDLNNRINTELEAMAKTLYDFWFVQFDFPFDFAQGKPDKNGKPYKSSGGKMVWNAELKREIPEGWDDSNILTVADLFGGGTPSKKKSEYWEGEIPFFTPTDANSDIYIISTQELITDKGLKNCSSILFDIGTVFITARGSVGKLIIIGREMAMNQSCYALKPKNGISSVFLFFIAKELVYHLQVKSSGSVFDSIVSNDIKLTYLAIPPGIIIDSFTKIVEPVFNQILLNLKQNEQLLQLRDWLLPMLMNGQVKVE